MARSRRRAVTSSKRRSSSSSSSKSSSRLRPRPMTAGARSRSLLAAVLLLRTLVVSEHAGTAGATTPDLLRVPPKDATAAHRSLPASSSSSRPATAPPTTLIAGD
ncbi:hypothetical protein H4S06_005874, partial [Coemansia sp. BCRC 34490]